ncbi:hypothetical protein F5I97DRAFT_950711 [Phlebopus sp. FC_14]|nr:hypothetical protein F5I97DRAFT_950711 [Phlebopus sp. FC_14]
MSFTNINDPAGVKALLERLKSSQAWQETMDADPSRPAQELTSPSVVPESSSSQGGQADSPAFHATSITPSTSVASLLSQLQSSAWNSAPSSDTSQSSQPSLHTTLSRQNYKSVSESPFASQSDQRPARTVNTAGPPPSSHKRVQDARSMSFQQALPHLTQLTESPEFVASVARLQEEQRDLERQLWEERSAIQKKHEEKVKIARTKAGLIGAGLSKHEADMMNDAYRKELQRFDSQRVLLAWDALTQKQQIALESLGVPTMFATDSQAHCEVRTAGTVLLITA